MDAAYRSASSLRVTAVVALLSVAVGCQKPSGLLGVTGEVLLDGAPVKRGTIRLTSMEPDKSATGAMIRDGKYEVPQAKGLSPGTYHVSISAGDEESTEVMTKGPSGGPGMAVAKELIPPEYNVNSKKTVELTGDGDNHFVFEITSGG